MLNKLKELNPNIKVFSVFDPEFKSFGRVIEGIDTEEIVKVAKSVPLPEKGSAYTPSLDKFEELKIAGEICDKLFGTSPCQIGFCWGYNTKMEATEWHSASEFNIATTDIVLILGHLWDVCDGNIDSSKFYAFYVPEGTLLECYQTSLHYCPCQTADSGFGSVVALPLGTNHPLEKKVDHKLVFAKNKFLIAHVDNDELRSEGAYCGLSGENYEIHY